MESILGNVAWHFVRWLPPFVLRRIFSPEWMKKNIYIDIRPRHTSVEIWLPENPHVNIYLDVRNNTHFMIEIDRILLKFFYGSELANLVKFEREYLKPGEERSLYFTSNIGYYQYQNLAFNHAQNASHCALAVMAEINTKLHNFRIEKTLEGIKPEVHNEHLLSATSKN